MVNIFFCGSWIFEPTLARQVLNHLSHSTGLFCLGIFRVSWTICLGWLQTVILLISASRVARITGVRHFCLAIFLSVQWAQYVVRVITSNEITVQHSCRYVANDIQYLYLYMCTHTYLLTGLEIIHRIILIQIALFCEPLFLYIWNWL
jgi:hypothetical protein